jgi:predicted  nucleic acid-binding Zn-ribbon protein
VTEELIEKFTSMRASYIMSINLLEQVQLKIERLNQDVNSKVFINREFGNQIERLSSEIHELRARLSASWGFRKL